MDVGSGIAVTVGTATVAPGVAAGVDVTSATVEGVGFEVGAATVAGADVASVTAEAVGFGVGATIVCGTDVASVPVEGVGFESGATTVATGVAVGTDVAPESAVGGVVTDVPVTSCVVAAAPDVSGEGAGSSHATASTIKMVTAPGRIQPFFNIPSLYCRQAPLVLQNGLCCVAEKLRAATCYGGGTIPTAGRR